MRRSLESRQKCLPKVVVGNQADRTEMYWKKKNIRKQRKWKPKKKAPTQPEHGKKTLLNFNILQANVCGLDKKKSTFGKNNE